MSLSAPRVPDRAGSSVPTGALSRRTVLRGAAVTTGALLAGPALSGCGLFSKHVDVLLLGDSIMNQSAPAVKQRLRMQKGIEDASTYAEAVNGSGLLTPKIYDWETKARELTDTYTPVITVALFVGNYTDKDLFIGSDGLEVPTDYSPKFYDEWGKQAEKVTRILKAKGSAVYWVLPPPFFGEEGKRREALLRDTYIQLAQRQPGVGLIDGRNALGDPTGAFAWELPGDDGKSVTVRQGDSLHLTEPGGERMARQIAFEIGPKLLEIRRQPAT